MPLRPPSPVRPRVRHWLHLICKRKNLKARQFRSFGKLFSTNGKMPLALSPQSGGGQLLLITPPNSRNWDHNQEGVNSWLITPPNSRNWDHNQEGVNSCCSSPQAASLPPLRGALCVLRSPESSENGRSRVANHAAHKVGGRPWRGVEPRAPGGLTALKIPSPGSGGLLAVAW
jgi:hypothetical protein